MSAEWINQAIFYHIYPLGLCGAPEVNHLSEPVVHRLDTLHPWLDHIQSIGANAIYLGPVFQSMSHGYDTVDYYQVDRRLGDHQTLQRFSEALHRRGMHLVLDGVFNHVGRDFWAFRDVIEHGPNSAYKAWFHNLRFGEQSPKGDPFTYDGWHGHYSLVKLNLSNPDVRVHLFDAISMWRSEFGIDGLRLDAADSIDFDFLKALREFTDKIHPGFWLMGEVVHGDYRQWANPRTLHTVTNYEAYKGLYSSLNDGNYH
jgi:glycosidase